MPAMFWVVLPIVVAAPALILLAVARSQRSAMVRLARALAFAYVPPRSVVDPGGARGAIGRVAVEVELGTQAAVVDGVIVSALRLQLRCSGAPALLDALAAVPAVDAVRVEARTLVVWPRAVGGLAAQRARLPEIIGLLRAAVARA